MVGIEVTPRYEYDRNLISCHSKLKLAKEVIQIFFQMCQKPAKAGFPEWQPKLASTIESGVLRSWVVVLTLFFSKWLTPMDQKLVTLNGGLYRQIRGFGKRWFYGHWPTLDQILSFIIFLSRSYIDSDHFCINLCRRLRPGSIPRNHGWAEIWFLGKASNWGPNITRD